MKYLSIVGLIFCWAMAVHIFIASSGFPFLGRLQMVIIPFLGGCFILPFIVLNFKRATIKAIIGVLVVAGIFGAGFSFALKSLVVFYPKIIVAQRYQSPFCDYLVVTYKLNPFNFVFKRKVILRIDDWDALTENIYYTYPPIGERNE